MTLFSGLSEWHPSARRVLTCAIVWIAAVMQPAEAAAQISIKPVQPPPATFEYSSASDAIRHVFTIANSGGTAQSLDVIVSPVQQVGGIQCDPGKPDCTLSWHVQGRAVLPGQLHTLTVNANGSAELVLEGVAKPVGIYRAEVNVRPSGAGTAFTPVSAAVVVKRPLLNLGVGALVFGPGGIRNPAWPFHDLQPLALTIANNSELPVHLAVIPDVQFLRDDGSGTFSVDAGRQKVDCPQKPPHTLLPGATLACTVVLSSLSAAGRYRAEVKLSQSGIASAEANRDFTVRLACFWAFATVLVGAFFGAWFAGWQNSGRRRALQSADALELKSSFTAIVRDLSGAPAQAIGPALVQQIIVRLDQMVTALAATSTADFASEIAALGARLPSIHRFATLEKAYFNAGPPPAALPAYGDAVAAINQSPPPADLQNKLDNLAAALSAAMTLGIRNASRVVGADAISPNQIFITWRTRSRDKLLRMVRNIDTFLLLIAIALVALIGVVVLWQPNAAWGDLGDILAALLTGFAATAAGTLSLRELATGYTLGKIK